MESPYAVTGLLGDEKARGTAHDALSCIPSDHEDCAPLVLGDRCLLESAFSVPPRYTPSECVETFSSSTSSTTLYLVLGVVALFIVVVVVVLIIFLVSSSNRKTAEAKRVNDEALTRIAVQEAAPEDDSNEVIVVQERRRYVVGYGKKDRGGGERNLDSGAPVPRGEGRYEVTGDSVV